MSIVNMTRIAKVYGFGDAATTALDGVSLTVKKGDFVAIMGASGSGKSTLMNVIGLLDRPTSGTYMLDGTDASRLSQRQRALIRRDKIGFIFQSFNLLPRINALENVALPLAYKSFGHIKRLEKAAEYLHKVGLGNRQYFMPSQLSGGQIQRVAIARALVNNPSIILADEPTGNLDTHSSEQVMSILKDINAAGNTIIMITHNPALAKYAQRVVKLEDGRIIPNRPVKMKKKGKQK